MSKPELPSSGTLEYLWWSRGAEDNQAAINEGLPSWVSDLRDLIPELYRCWKAQEARPVASESELVLGLARIYCPNQLKDADLPDSDACRNCGRRIIRVATGRDDGALWLHFAGGVQCRLNAPRAEPALCGSGTSPAACTSGQEGGETVAEISDCSLRRAGTDGKIRLAAIQAGVSLRFTVSELKTLLGIALRA